MSKDNQELSWGETYGLEIEIYIERSEIETHPQKTDLKTEQRPMKVDLTKNIKIKNITEEILQISGNGIKTHKHRSRR